MCACAAATQALYQEMRSLGIAPDELMVDCLLRACYKTRQGGLTAEDGRLILADLQTLDWAPELIAEKADLLRAVVSTVSEVCACAI